MARSRNVQDDILKAILKAIRQTKPTKAARQIPTSRIPSGASKAARQIPTSRPNSLLQRGGRAAPKRSAKMEELGEKAAKRAKAENVLNASKARTLRRQRRGASMVNKSLRQLEREEATMAGKARKGQRKPTKQERVNAGKKSAARELSLRDTFKNKWKNPQSVSSKIRQLRDQSKK